MAKMKAPKDSPPASQRPAATTTIPPAEPDTPLPPKPAASSDHTTGQPDAMELERRRYETRKEELRLRSEMILSNLRRACLFRPPDTPTFAYPRRADFNSRYAKEWADALIRGAEFVGKHELKHELRSVLEPADDGPEKQCAKHVLRLAADGNRKALVSELTALVDDVGANGDGNRWHRFQHGLESMAGWLTTKEQNLSALALNKEFPIAPARSEPETPAPRDCSCAVDWPKAESGRRGEWIYVCGERKPAPTGKAADGTERLLAAFPNGCRKRELGASCVRALRNLAGEDEHWRAAFRLPKVRGRVGGYKLLRRWEADHILAGGTYETLPE